MWDLKYRCYNMLHLISKIIFKFFWLAALNYRICISLPINYLFILLKRFGWYPSQIILDVKCSPLAQQGFAECSDDVWKLCKCNARWRKMKKERASFVGYHLKIYYMYIGLGVEQIEKFKIPKMWLYKYVTQ